MAKHLEDGKSAELKALNFLLEKKYLLEEQNYRSGRGEIDLIVRKDNFLVFVEVKMRKSNAFGYPEEAVDRKKTALLLKTADDYIFDKNWKGNIRFDIIAVSPNEILHLEDAFG